MIKKPDHAIFLPAISNFYATFIGKQRYGEYVDYTRVPSNFTNGVEGLNFLNKKEAYFYYSFGLYSAGHANLNLNKFDAKEDMIRKRDRKTSILVGDSGGFQIGKGVWEGDWKNPSCPKAEKQRRLVLTWLEEQFDYAMTLDVPAWTAKNAKAREKTGILTYDDAITATKYNNEYFIKNREGKCKFLNVLQGETHLDSDNWYEIMKEYSDPKKYPKNHFNGWAMGGQNMTDVHLALKRIITLKFDNLLEPGVHDWIHFLGTSRLEWALVLSDIQRAVRKYHNPNLIISFDCASPFLATANGKVYYDITLNHKGKWMYQMEWGPDDKKYATDTRTYGKAVLDDKVFKTFQESPITTDLLIKDVCVYKPGDLNKIGKEGNTSWDSFSYVIQMAHNTWMHIESVRRANELYDNGQYPKMLVEIDHDKKVMGELIDELFSIKTKEKALEFLDEHSKFWMNVVGTRGNKGKKAMNAETEFKKNFQFDGHVQKVAKKKKKTPNLNFDSLFVVD